MNTPYHRLPFDHAEDRAFPEIASLGYYDTMCAGKLQAIFCGFDKGERGQIRGTRLPAAHCMGGGRSSTARLPLEWHAPIASVAALIERLAGCSLVALPDEPHTPFVGERHAAPGAVLADWCRLALKTVKTKGLSLRGRAAPVAISGRSSYVFAGSTQLSGRVLRDFPCRFVPRNDTSRRCGGASVLLRG